MKSRKKIRDGIDTLEVLKKHFPYIYTRADLTRVFVSGIGTGIVVGIIFWATFATASELRHSFRSPAFNGQGFSSHVLTIENLTHERKQSIKAKKESEAREAEREANNTNINKFMRNFESRVYAELSKQLSEKLFGEDAADSGTISILGNTVTYETVGQEIQMTITQADGTTTTLINQKFASVMPKVAETPMKKSLKDFPGIKNGKPVSVAVYSFSDKTGQRKPSDNIAQLSSAVTQGGEIYLIKALMDLSDGKFFNVVERGSIEYLLKERQIIRNARKTFDGEKAKRLGALQFAGIMITGGVVGYDSNKFTGGAGVRFLGIGPKSEWRVDVVTIGLRAVSVLTGEVLISVTTEKTILSTSVGLNVFKFYDMGTKVLEVEAGTSTNEPINYAVRQGIEDQSSGLTTKGTNK